MTQGYWQINVQPESQRYTASATTSGLYAWLVTPYRLRNSAATFQRIMNEVLQPHKGYASAYIDNVAVYLETWEALKRHLEVVLTTIESVGLTVNTDKCKLAQPSVKYLSDVVGWGKHSPDPERVSVIAGLKVPMTKKELRSALGLFNYYRDYVLAHLNNGFVLRTAALERDVGACLAQELDGQEKPIAFLRKMLTPQQAKWSAIEQEAFVVVWH